MKSDDLNKWLTLGANVGVLVGIILLIVELNQNSTLMRAQIFNERAGHGISQFMAMADSELSEIDAMLREAGFPENAAAFATLTQTQQMQYYWYLRADRFRVENLLYQQLLEVLENDSGPVVVGRFLMQKYEAMYEAGFYAEAPNHPRLRGLIERVEEKHRQELD